MERGQDRSHRTPRRRTRYRQPLHRFLASGKIASQPENGLHLNINELQGLEWRTLAELYIFGEKYQDDPFCNAVVSAMADLSDRRACVQDIMPNSPSDATEEDFIDHMGERLERALKRGDLQDRWAKHPYQKVVELIYGGTPQSSPVRKLMVAIHIKEPAMPAWMKDESDGRNAEFTKDLLGALFEERRMASVEQLKRYAGKHAMFARREEFFKK